MDFGGLEENLGEFLMENPTKTKGRVMRDSREDEGQNIHTTRDWQSLTGGRLTFYLFLFLSAI